MNTKILVCMLAVIFLAACKKDKYNTTPTIALESVSNKVVSNGGILNVQLRVTDKEGDISDTLYFKKIRTNIKTKPTLRDSLTFKIPSVPDTRTGFITLDLEYTNHLISATDPGPRGSTVNDTLTLQFTVRDKAKNKSNTISIDNVVIIR